MPIVKCRVTRGDKKERSNMERRGKDTVKWKAVWNPLYTERQKRME
jgi:hypothetical protein